MRQLSDFSSAPGFPRSVAVSRLAFALSLFAFASCSRAQEQSATSISREVKDVFERSAKAVVKIHGADEHSEFFAAEAFPAEHVHAARAQHRPQGHLDGSGIGCEVEHHSEFLARFAHKLPSQLG